MQLAVPNVRHKTIHSTRGGLAWLTIQPNGGHRSSLLTSQSLTNTHLKTAVRWGSMFWRKFCYSSLPGSSHFLKVQRRLVLLLVSPSHPQPSWHMLNTSAVDPRPRNDFQAACSHWAPSAPWPWKRKCKQDLPRPTVVQLTARRLLGEAMALASAAVSSDFWGEEPLSSHYCMGYIIRAHCRWPRTAYQYRCLTLFNSCVPENCGVGGIIK